jgi:DNA-binding CsgD family transcriptional regulator/PAS domain-containing protein
MDHSEKDGFLGLLYDATLDSALWVPVMERFADLIGGTGVCISHLNMFDGTGSAIGARVDPAAADLYFEYYAQRNPLSNVDNPAVYLRDWTPRILTDEDWMPKDALLRTEYYNDFQSPQDFDSTLMIRLGKQDPFISVLNVMRPRRSGQFGPAEIALAESLHPHLIRAFRISRQFAELQLARDGMAQALDISPHGIFLIDESGRVRHANRAGEALINEGGALSVVGGRLAAASPDATRQLHGLIMRAASPGRETRVGGSMAVTSPKRRVPLSLTVAPLRMHRFEFLRDRLAAIACVVDPESGASPPQRALRDLFGLTPAESKVAMALFEGRTSKEAADHLGLSFHTVRVHLAHIFGKTQTNRQSELVRLMMGVTGVEMV